MSNLEILESPRARILTAEEVLALQQQGKVRAFVDQKMKDGKASRVHGWCMADILADVVAEYGEAHEAYARKYLIEDVCGIKKAPSKTRLSQDEMN